MRGWTPEELQWMAEADDFHGSPFREDGKTYGTLTLVWCVVVDDAVYIRAYHGQQSSWYQAAIKQKAGKVSVAGMTKEVIFEPG